MTPAMQHNLKKFKLRAEYEKVSGKEIKTDPREYYEWLECQLIANRETVQSLLEIGKRDLGTTFPTNER